MLVFDKNSEVIDTTEKLFGPELHKYTIDEAISDGNVLGFHVDCINTGEFKSYEDLKEAIIEDEKQTFPDKLDKAIERLVYSWDDLEVEKQASKRKLLEYHDDTHIPRVVEEIIENWESQSQQRKFNAILTVAYKKRVLAYFEEFKKQLAEHDAPFNVPMTFSFGGTRTLNQWTLKWLKICSKIMQHSLALNLLQEIKNRGQTLTLKI